MALICGANLPGFESKTFGEDNAKQVPASQHEDVPRIFPKEPDEAIKTFQAPKGFRMDLIVREPLITSPVAIAYDENGKMYVAEMVDFPFPERTAGKPNGRVRVVLDNDGDGKFDTSSIFVDGLLSPSSVACWKGGVFVATLGDIWYFKNTKGSGEADVRIKVFTGFGLGSPEYMQNGLAWGINHKIYGSAGPNGGEVRQVNRPDAKPVSLAGRDFCFDPVTGELEAVSGGGSQWGNAFDDSYNRFVCKNIAPARHVVLPFHYLARNPYLGVPHLYKPLTSEEGDVAVYRASPPEPWRSVRARRRQELGKNANPGEINEAGYFTAACGITVYRGAAYPPSYRGNLFIAEPAGNLVHRRSLDPDGVSFVSRRVDEKAEVIASSDNFFRPVNFVNAPDGTLHVVDMYREVVEDPKYVPDDLMKTGQVNVEGGRERGRIYRLTPPDFIVPKSPRLGKAATVELVAHLENPNSWWRETAQRLLYERQDRSAVDLLRKLLAKSELPQARLHALWSLEGLKALREEDIAVALADRSAVVREHAVRFAEGKLTRHPELLAKVMPLATDQEPRVRFQVAFTLGQVDVAQTSKSAVLRSSKSADGPSVPKRQDLLRPADLEIGDTAGLEARTTAQGRTIAGLAQIAARDAGDTWIRTAVLSSSVECANNLFETLLRNPAFLRLDGAMVLLKELAFTAGARNQREEVDQVLGAVTTTPDPRVQMSAVVALGDGLRQAHSDLLSRLLDDTSSPASQMLNKLFSHAEQISTDSEAPTDARQDATTLLGYGRFQSVQARLSGLLEARQPQEVQLATVRALARYERPEVATILLDRWRSSPPAVQGEMADALLARSEWIGPFLDAVKTQKVSAAMIGATRRALLLKHADRSVRDRATALFGDVASTPRNEVIARYRTALSSAGDWRRGQQVFERICVACHRFGDKGNDIGPNLSAYGQPSTSSEKLLSNILDPNREVSPEYIGYDVTLKDGRVLAGIVATQTPTSITLKQPGNSMGTIILRNNIEEVTSNNLSLMPEGLEQSINIEDMADLLAFLLAIRGGI
jgi:putative membrane-bound dehydrogenase-like protein